MSRALPDGLHLGRRDHGLIPVIAAVAAIAALALGGWTAARSLSREWEDGAAQQVTIEIPDFTGEAKATADKLIAVLSSDPGIAAVEMLPEVRIRDSLRPFLGSMQGGLSDLPVILAITRKNGVKATDLSSFSIQSLHPPFWKKMPSGVKGWLCWAEACKPAPGLQYCLLALPRQE
ncbi:hypothetical protein [Asaia prunellae]|uniref:hypothetical protein n=1 Tax=Asaia prunellae TaxID=610245 RepID=UPI00046F98F6|nr:hypothetical protein [Asaia prunellae]